MKDIAPSITRVIDVDAEDSLFAAFGKLAEHRILSLPVFDSKRQKYKGM